MQPDSLPGPAVAAVPSAGEVGPAAAGRLWSAVAVGAMQAAAAARLVLGLAAVAAEVHAVWQHTADTLHAGRSVERHCMAAAAAALPFPVMLLQRGLVDDSLAVLRGAVVANSLQMACGVFSLGSPHRDRLDVRLMCCFFCWNSVETHQGSAVPWG